MNKWIQTSTFYKKNQYGEQVEEVSLVVIKSDNCILVCLCRF